MADPDQRGNGRLDLATGQELPDAGNIDKIRDILFGAQSREFDKRMARLEERLTKEAGNLKDDMRRRFEALETYVKRELESLSERVDAERQDRVVGLKGMSSELKEAAESVEAAWSPGRTDDQEPAGSASADSRSIQEPVRRGRRQVSLPPDVAGQSCGDPSGGQDRLGGSGGPVHRIGASPQQRLQASWAGIARAQYTATFKCHVD